MIGEVDAKLVGEKIASEDGVGAIVDETVQERGALGSVSERDLDEGAKHRLTERVC